AARGRAAGRARIPPARGGPPGTAGRQGAPPPAPRSGMRRRRQSPPARDSASAPAGVAQLPSKQRRAEQGPSPRIADGASVILLNAVVGTSIAVGCIYN